VLVKLWEASDYGCSQRLAPFLPELIDVLERHGELIVSAEEKAHLTQIKPATIDRLLTPERRRRPQPPMRQSPASRTIKGQVPIRTFGDWTDVEPGSRQADLV